MCKTKILFSIICLTLLNTSCQSEYQERLDKVKQLKEKYSEINSNEDANLNAQLELQRIEKEIKFHAIQSGNEELIYKEINLSFIP